MGSPPRICVVIPVYNHDRTVQDVVRLARRTLPVIVVNDGSTDRTGAILEGAREEGVWVVTLPCNQGKGAALQAGFAEARQRGFTHVVTLDADGQHSPEALPQFVAACGRHPEALIVGVRDWEAAKAPFARRATNAVSNFWFRFETGLHLTDTQCGYRCYPLGALAVLRLESGRYAFELEVMVKAAWAGIPLVPHPVHADYAAPTSRLSHFDPMRDLLQISWLHSRFSLQSFCVPAPLRRLAVNGRLRAMPWRQRWGTVLRHVFAEHTETPARLASAVSVGLFCGIAPIWGFQMLAAAALAHRWRLNKAVALTASHVSFPLAAPFILAAGLVLGHFVWNGGWIEFDPEAIPRQIPLYLWEWVLGSILLALLVAGLGWLVTLSLARIWGRNRAEPAT